MGKDYRLGMIIESLLEFLDKDIKELEKERTQVLIGHIMGYVSALKLIQEELSDQERKEFKLDFDIDKKYM